MDITFQGFGLASAQHLVASPLGRNDLPVTLSWEASMPIHLQREINFLNRLILQLGGQVEENLRKALSVVHQQVNPDPGEFLQRDREVNRLEIRVEETCLKILALHQPVASDLRYIVSMMKINNDLERVGDLAEHIARRGSKLKPLALPEMIDAMAVHIREMLRESLDAMVQLDLERCRAILKRDREVDALNQEVHRWFLTEANDGARGGIETLMQVLLTAKDLERIGDHTCNIAEDVIYLVSGEIVRHMETDERPELS